MYCGCSSSAFTGQAGLPVMNGSIKVPLPSRDPRTPSVPGTESAHIASLTRMVLEWRPARGASRAPKRGFTHRYKEEYEYTLILQAQ